ncbi:UNVERIFIED_CONTAM: hypothetical protein NY603_31045, partial [Bacteroidetes bacterium 56_B9]
VALRIFLQPENFLRMLCSDSASLILGFSLSILESLLKFVALLAGISRSLLQYADVVGKGRHCRFLDLALIVSPA